MSFFEIETELGNKKPQRDLASSSAFSYQNPDARLQDINRSLSRLTTTQGCSQLYSSIEVHTLLADLHDGIAVKLDALAKKRVPLAFYRDDDFPKGESRLARDGFGQKEQQELLECAKLMQVHGFHTEENAGVLARFINEQISMSKPQLEFAQKFAEWRARAWTLLMDTVREKTRATQGNQRKSFLDFAAFNRSIATLHRIIIDALRQDKKKAAEVLTGVTCKMRSIGSEAIVFYAKD